MLNYSKIQTKRIKYANTNKTNIKANKTNLDTKIYIITSKLEKIRFIICLIRVSIIYSFSLAYLRLEINFIFSQNDYICK
jgi:hypothetical protein